MYYHKCLAVIVALKQGSSAYYYIPSLIVYLYLGNFVPFITGSCTLWELVQHHTILCCCLGMPHDNNGLSHLVFS